MKPIQLRFEVIITIDPLDNRNPTLVVTGPIKPKTRQERASEHIKAQRVASKKKKHRYTKV